MPDRLKELENLRKEGLVVEGDYGADVVHIFEGDSMRSIHVQPKTYGQGARSITELNPKIDNPSNNEEDNE